MSTEAVERGEFTESSSADSDDEAELAWQAQVAAQLEEGEVSAFQKLEKTLFGRGGPGRFFLYLIRWF